MKVIATIQSTISGPDFPPPPVEIQYYKGDDLAQAMSSMMMVMAGSTNDPGWTRLISARIEF